MSFEDILGAKAKEKAAKKHQEKIDLQKKADRDENRRKDLEEEKQKKADAITSKPEWKKMVELSQNDGLIKALKLYWLKFSNGYLPEVIEEVVTKMSFSQRLITGQKYKKNRYGKTPRVSRTPTFEEALKIEFAPTNNTYGPNGFISISIHDKSVTDHPDGDAYSVYHTIYIFYNEKNDLIVRFGAFVGPIEKLFHFMASKLVD